MKTIYYTIKLPVAADELGRWLETNGASIQIQCMLGIYHVTVTKKKVLSYSDETGFHYEKLELSRHDRDMMSALESALRAAGAIAPVSP